MGATVYSFNEFIQLDTLYCGECGVTFAVPARFVVERTRDGKQFYCPNGHARVFREPEVERLRKALEAERAARQRLEELRRVALKDAEHNAIERRKTQTRMRNLKARIKNGVCPCCKRSFVQLARHMATKHPEYGDAHEPQQG